MLNLTGSVALVTGANCGLGAHLVAELLRARAAVVNATSRTFPAAAAGAPPRAQPVVRVMLMVGAYASERRTAVSGWHGVGPSE